MVARMSGDRSVEWKEMGFLVLLGVLCVVISVLQFRWTGELAKAEYERLGKNQREGAMNLAETFDHELASECRALLPDADDFAGNPVKEFSLTVRRWLNEVPDPWFKRLGVVIPEPGGLKLVMADPKTGATAPAEWPEEWMGLQPELLARMEGVGPFPVSGDGWLLEFPVMKQAARGKRGAGHLAGWLVVELDREFVAGHILPGLVAKYLNPTAGENYFEIRVTSASGEMIFSEGKSGDRESSMKLPLHRQGRDGVNLPGPPGMPVWSMEVFRRTTELERVTKESRLRNVVLGLAVNGLILLAGIALVGHSRKSRLLAKERMDFVANVSHELRTPVTVIVGAAHNLRRGIVRTPEALDRYSALISRHAEQLSEMVQEVLDFSVARKGKVAYAMTATDPGEVLWRAIDEARGEIGEVELETSIPEKLPKVMADAAALRRAFGNLIRNAAKHGGEGGWIGVRAEVRGRNVVVAVSDRGPGIPVAEQRSVFTPFFRGEGAREKQVRGSGIGLGLVKEIVEAHDGEVSVCSEPGSGAIFTIVLPVMAQTGDEHENPVG